MNALGSIFLVWFITIVHANYYNHSTELKTLNSTQLTAHENVTNLKQQVNATFDHSVNETSSNNVTAIEIANQKLNTSDVIHPCRNCSKNEVCLKIAENDTVICKSISDYQDPTGCGGLCKINFEYCKLLDATEHFYQCLVSPYVLNCTNTTFNCGNMCIPIKYKCDGVFHCTDHSDERGCECDLNTHFRCANFKGCFHFGKVCDGAVDCMDKSDELGCHRVKCPPHQFSCGLGACVNITNFCDGFLHCPNGADEPSGCIAL